MGPLKTAKVSRPRVWDQFSISIVLPVLSHGPVCTVIVSLLDILGVVFHICIHWPLIGFRLAIRGLGRIEAPRKVSNMLICPVSFSSTMDAEEIRHRIEVLHETHEQVATALQSRYPGRRDFLLEAHAAFVKSKVFGDLPTWTTTHWMML